METWREMRHLRKAEVSRRAWGWAEQRCRLRVHVVVLMHATSDRWSKRRCEAWLAWRCRRDAALRQESGPEASTAYGGVALIRVLLPKLAERSMAWVALLDCVLHRLCWKDETCFGVLWSILVARCHFRTDKGMKSIMDDRGDNKGNTKAATKFIDSLMSEDDCAQRLPNLTAKGLARVTEVWQRELAWGQHGSRCIARPVHN